MAGLDLLALPPELQAALERAWPDCPEAQKRAVLAPARVDAQPIWPRQLWPWRPGSRWWRPGWARERRRQDQAFFAAHWGDARGEPQGHEGPSYPQKLFDPAQPFFPTPWTQARVLLVSPAPEVFSDADFWIFTQRLFGGDAVTAGREMLRWARGMQADDAVSGRRRGHWLADAHWRLHMSATGALT
jgi:hypothetical protein